QTLRQMTINVAKGISGIQYGSRPVPIEGVDMDDLRQVATEWLTPFFNAFSQQITDRDNYLAGAPPVLAAIGALGNKIYQAAPGDRAQVRNQLIATLQAVDWGKADRWAGIAGKINNGKFSVGGTKE